MSMPNEGNNMPQHVGYLIHERLSKHQYAK